MSRHSKNNTANPVFTYAERKMIRDFGTQNARIGSDSQRPFEYCYLCVSKVVDPMCCHKGHLFCKECILTNLVKQKKEITLMTQTYKQKMEAKQQQKANEELELLKQKELEFEKLDYQNDVAERKQFKEKVDEKMSGYLHQEENLQQQALEKLHQKGKEMLTSSKSQLINKNFWIPESQPIQQEGAIKVPHKECICPATKDHEIKYKKLYKVNLKEIDGEVFCYACNKTIKYQKVGMSKECGHVMCLNCLEKVCLPDERCMVCSKSLKKKEIIQLQEAYSGYASHNKVEVTTFNPVMLI